MTAEQVWETPESHDATGGLAVIEDAEVRALPTPSTPGYGTYHATNGTRWTACDCMIAWLPWLERLMIFKGLIKHSLDVWQLTGGAAASAGTHSQGGAGDLLHQTSNAHIAVIREMGAPAGWRRTVAQGFSAEHAHFVLLGCPHNTPARYQITAQRAGYNGLGNAGRGGKDDQPGPSTYRTWQQGIAYAKRELGLMAAATTTTLGLSPGTYSIGSWSHVNARTTQAGTAYAVGVHVYEYYNATTKAWTEFARRSIANGVSDVYWKFGGSHAVRVRFAPTDYRVSAASVSGSASVYGVDVPALQNQVKTLTAQASAQKSQIATLTTQVATLTKRIADLEKADPGTPPPVDPPKPVPAYGVDVSGYQTVEQVQALAADPGVGFIIIKASEGATYKSSAYAAQRAAAGTKYVGAYHYTGTPGNAVTAECDAFFGVWDGTGVPALDVETAVTPIFVLGWLDVVFAKTGRRPLVYTNWDWLKGNPTKGIAGLRPSCTVEQWERLCEYPFWLADIHPAGQPSPIDPKPGSGKVPTVVVHQYAYTPDKFGKTIDRDWTADLAKLRAMGGLK